MKDCIILEFEYYYMKHELKRLESRSPYKSDTIVFDFPDIQEQINAYLNCGYVIKGFSVNTNYMVVCLLKDD